MTQKSRAEAVLFTATLIWGSTFTGVKLILPEVPAVQMVFWRMAFASLVLLLIARTKLFPIRGTALVKGGILGTLLFLGFVTQNVGMNYTTASKSAFITGMMVVFVPLLQFIVERRAPKVGNVRGVVIVSVGLWFLTSPAGSGFNVGDALTLSCAFLFGIYIVYLDVVAHELTAMQLTFIQCATNAVLAFVGMLLFETVTFAWSGQTIAILAYLTLFATVITTYTQTRYQKDTTPTRAAVIFSIEPLIASVIAYFVLGERLGELGILGGALIILGVLTSELSDLIPVLSRSMDWTDNGELGAVRRTPP
ncbi:DMT family transporter [bacterium]|nr:MAG: DMT family transporter [bacterium]